MKQGRFATAFDYVAEVTEQEELPMLERLARFSYRRRRYVVATWVVALILIQGVGGAIGNAFSQKFQLPPSETKDVIDLLNKADPGEAGLSGRIVFEARTSATDPAVQAAMTSIFTRVGQLKNVAVRSPFDANNPNAASQLSNKDPKIGYAELQFPDLGNDQLQDLAKEIKDIGKAAPPEIRVEYGGDMFREFSLPPTEILGLLAAVLILLVAFGSLIAMGLPIAIALMGLGMGFGIVTFITHVMDMPDISIQIMSMIGLGVGIDYALFIVSRYREELRRGSSPEDAVAESLDTAGRATLFAGITVVASLMGMFLMGFSFVRGLAVAGSVGVLMMMIGTVTLLPALLGFVGRNIDKFKVGRHKDVDPTHTFWYRWSQTVQRRPWPAFVGALAVLLVLAIPMLSLRLGTNDASTDPKGATARDAYELLSDGFGPGFNGPLILVAQVPAGAQPASVAKVKPAVQALKNKRGEDEVAFVADPVIANGLARWFVVPTTTSQSEQTSQLVHQIRKEALPQATVGTDLKVRVGGFTAGNIDFADFLGKRLPVFMGAVLIVSFLLLMMVFRSILVPIKAVIMNLLSIGAAYGVSVAIFQWGWMKSLVGLSEIGPIETWAPMMLFAIVFGLSMDYEVFLLSRIRESYDRTGDNASAVADGLATTARVITAAALIMVCVFMSFVLGEMRVLKMFGTSLAVAVFIDATIVRMVLVPATMELLGKRNWWMPRWLDKILPTLHVEGTHHRPGVPAAVVEREPVSDLV
jgi:RND superfamily putative drug exporter